jgi:hypothetical protein
MITPLPCAWPTRIATVVGMTLSAISWSRNSSSRNSSTLEIGSLKA